MTHLFLKNAGITNKYYDEIMLKVDFDRTQFARISEMVANMGKHHQTFPDDDHKHLLYQEEGSWDDSDESYTEIEYFTDAAGQWYIWDWSLDAGYYLDVSEEENQYFAHDTWVYWDQCNDTRDYEEWDNAAYETDYDSSWDNDDSWDEC